MRFWRFFTVVVTILLCMQLYLAWAVAGWVELLPFSEHAKMWIDGTLLLVLLYFNLSIPLRLVVRANPGKDLTWLKWIVIFPGTTWLITMLMMFTAFLARDAADFAVRWFLEGPGTDSHSLFLQLSGATALAAPLIVSGYGALRTARDYRVERIDLPFPNLPAGLDGFQIAQISDIHSGIYMTEREMHNIREIMDSLHPQIAALTGDFVDSLAAEIAPVARVFSKLKTDFGVYGCMGNHDLFDDYRAVSAAMKDSGIHMLENNAVKIQADGAELNLLGVADSGSKYTLTHMDPLMSDIEPEEFKILLAHRPGFFPAAVQAGIDLQLSGHTHGGQIGVHLGPYNLNLARIFERFISGLYAQEKTRLYVNSGVGMVFAPIRIGVRPEITLITLRKAKPSPFVS